MVDQKLSDLNKSYMYCFISLLAPFMTSSKLKFTKTNILEPFSLHLYVYIFELFYAIQFDVNLVQ